MRVERWRKVLALLGALSLALGSLAVLRPAAPAQAQAAGQIWAEPINLSQSGAASLPNIVALDDGSLHVLWWDRFDGTKYASYSPTLGWSRVTTVRAIAGGRERTGQAIPPADLRLYADQQGWLHAMWLASDGDLMYSRKRVGGTDWSNGLQLATTPLAWDFSVDAANRVHVAFIKPTQTGNLAAGVYYRLGTLNGGNWSNANPVSVSPYFRTLSADRAHVSVVSDGADQTTVMWDDPQLGLSIYAPLVGGQFEAPVTLEAGDITGGAPPQRLSMTTLPTGAYLGLWQAGAGCALYQQQIDLANQAWSPPLRVLEALSTCPRLQRSHFTSSGKLLSIMEFASGGQAMALWDGTAWSDPFTPEIAFLNPLSDVTTTLGCLKMSFTLDHITAVGCDGNGDVWVTSSLLTVDDLLPALQSAWTSPAVLSQTAGDVGLPSVALDNDGLMHVVWSEGSPGGPGAALTYARGDGVLWSVASGVLRAPSGKSEDPALVVDPGGMVHVVWSGGASGQIYYSRAFVRDATTPSGWSTPRLIAEAPATGGSPSLTLDPLGHLHLVFAAPLNEGRGVYYTGSADQGITWAPPQRMFDAGAAGWERVGETHLVLDEFGRRHVLWTRTTLPEPSLPLEVYYARSEDGQTWSAPAPVTAGTAERPRLLAAGGDQLHRTWVAESLDNLELWHQVSVDGGLNWTEAQRVLDTTTGLAPNVALATDGQGEVFLTGIEGTAARVPGLFYLRWDGQSWVDRERLILGYAGGDEAGAVALLLPDANLASFFRVTTVGNEGRHYVVGYTQRPVTAGPVTVLPTFTPPPADTATPQPTVTPTVPPSPTPNLNTAVSAPTNDAFWLQIGGVLGGMLLVSAIAVGRLVRGRRQ